MRKIDRERWEIVADLCRAIDPQAECEGIAKALEGLFDGLWMNILFIPAPSRAAQATAFLALGLPERFGPDEADCSRGS